MTHPPDREGWRSCIGFYEPRSRPDGRDVPGVGGVRQRLGLGVGTSDEDVRRALAARELRLRRESLPGRTDAEKLALRIEESRRSARRAWPALESPWAPDDDGRLR